MSQQIYMIGICGPARCGKNTTASILVDLFLELGFNVKQYALANALKQDMQDFLKQKCDVDVWVDDTKIKETFRTALVWYGCFQRNKTSGRYWTNYLEKEILKDHDSIIKNNKPYIAIVSDIRFKEYEYDEVDWVKRAFGDGSLIYVDREGILPANIEEGRNDTVLRENADFTVRWGDLGIYSSDKESRHIEYIKPIFDELLVKLIK